jgi:hypothetical protein
MIPIAPNREESNAGRSAVSIHDDDKDSKPDPVISTDLTLQDDATRDDSRKRKAKSIHMHTSGSEHTRTKRPKNKQDRRAMSDTEDNALNDEDRKPAAKNTSPKPDGVLSTCAGFKRKSMSTRAESVVSTSGQGIKLEPVIKTETSPTNPSTDQAEASINVPNLNRTVTVCRRAAKRTDPLYLAPPPPPQNIAAPLPLPPSPTPQAEEIKPRVEEPLPPTTDEADRMTASPDLPVDLPIPDTPPPSRRSRCQIQLPPTETSEAELDDTAGDFDDDDDDDDDDDYIPPPTVNVNTSIRRRSTRRTAASISPLTATLNVPTRRRSFRSVIPTSSTNNPVPPAAATTPRRRSSRRVIPPPSTAVVDISTLRRRPRQTQLSPIETQLDDDDGGDLSGSSWENRLRELTDYRKIHGHCNVPAKYCENAKLANWVHKQRSEYKSHLEGKKSLINISRIQALESLGFEWDMISAWEDRLSELAEYRKIHGHCNVPAKYCENAKLANWVNTQRKQYNWHLEGKRSPMTLSRIQELESLGFEWGCVNAAWEDRLSELADYRKEHGHCNVPQMYSENTKLGRWVGTQRKQYNWHLQGKPSPMTLSRIQELESLDFDWSCVNAAWEARLGELAEYRKIHGHCNVPFRYSENAKLGIWVANQRRNYRWYLGGKASQMTVSRSQALESLGFK